MVKPLRRLLRIAKLIGLGLLLCLIWGTLWLQMGVHSLDRAKPWILRSLNPADAPYTINFEQATADWHSLVALGGLHITHVTVSKRDGTVFAQLPEVYVKIDPFGFLPRHTLVYSVALHGANLSLTRGVDGALRVGLEGGDAVPVTDLLPASDDKAAEAPATPITVPFHDFLIDGATVKFHDDKTASDIESNAAVFHLRRLRGSHYQGTLHLPFIYDTSTGQLDGELLHNAGRNDYRVELQLHQLPAKLICTFACPADTHVEGSLSGEIRLGLLPDASLGAVWAHLTTQDALLTAPAMFEEPLHFGPSEITMGYDLAANTANVSSMKLTFDDTTVNATITASKKEDGWYADVDGGATHLDILKLPKYWPLTLAHDTRTWTAAKMRGGWTEGTAKLHITPAIIAGGDLTDEAVDADISAHDTSVDYLQGFPLLQHLDGQIHFTGTTVKVDAKNGTMLTGTKVSKALLICPELLNPRNPMDITFTSTMPMADVATLMAEPVFNHLETGLDPKKATGTLTSTMKLKFNSFPAPGSHEDPNAVHLDAIKYDIDGHLDNFAQTGVAGGYDIKNMTGDLKAGMQSASFNGALALGDSGMSHINLTHESGKLTRVEVKSEPAAQGKPSAKNDFTLNYKPGTIPRIVISGNRLDASVEYGGTKNSILRDFPAISLDIKLGELFLDPLLPFTTVIGTLECTAVRCESAHFTAQHGKSRIKADISRPGATRELVLTASDAGEFLKGLDITDRMTGGKLELRGRYDDTKNPSLFTSRLIVQDFNLKNSQILGRILSIGSLTGLANLLTGSGISFDKLGATIDERAGIVTVSEGKANGNAMGITIGGTVDTNTTGLALKGVVVPAYALNSILSSIPIIGAIAGGDEGLIAFNYSIKGTYNQPDVSVNALSGLTPGFLRGIFGMFDQPTPSINSPRSTQRNNFNQPDSPPTNTREALPTEE